MVAVEVIEGYEAVFERMTPEARAVLDLALDEAHKLRHNYLGTEHLLLGLLRQQEGLAAQALQNLNILIERIRAHVVRVVGRGDERTFNPDVTVHTPRVRKVLELALRETMSLRHPNIGPEHILLGLVHEDRGVATRVLIDFDAELDRVRGEVIRLLSKQSGQRIDQAIPSPQDRIERAMAELDEAIMALLENSVDREVVRGVWDDFSSFAVHLDSRIQRALGPAS